jgi:hypothetical protein
MKELKNFEVLDEKINLFIKNYEKLLAEKEGLQVDLKEKEEQIKISVNKIKKINDVQDLLKKKLNGLIKKIEKITC